MISFLLGVLRIVFVNCALQTRMDISVLPAYQYRKFHAATDWPLVLTAFELSVANLKSASVHVAILCARLVGMMYVCAHTDCPTGAQSQLMCGDTTCCNVTTTWAKPHAMCALPGNYDRSQCHDLNVLPDVTYCRVWGCDAKATPLDAFTVQWQIAASAFGAILYGIKQRSLHTTENDKTSANEKQPATTARSSAKDA